MATFTVHLVRDVDNQQRPEMGLVVMSGKKLVKFLPARGITDPYRAMAFGHATGIVSGWFRKSVPCFDDFESILGRSLTQMGFAVTETVEIDNLAIEDIASMSMDELRALKEFRQELAAELE